MTEVTAVEIAFTLTVTVVQEVVLHNPSALTKYVVVATGIKEMPIPEAIEAPPQLPAYQFHIPPAPEYPPFTINCMGLPEQAVAGTVEIDDANVELELTNTDTLTQLVELQLFSALTK